MDGMSLFVAAVQILITVGCIVAPVAIMMGRILERIKQLEARLDGNGDSVPGRCRVHDEKLGSLGRRVVAIEDSLR